LKRSYKLALMLGLLALVITTPGCGIVNKLRAKNSLNEGVREFNKGKYQAAEDKFKQSLELSPDMTNAQLFYARALNSQFDQNLTENLGLRTIQSYEDIVKRNPDNAQALEQSLLFEANIYDQMSRIDPDKAEQYKQKRRETLMRRAQLSDASPKAKADVYHTIGVSYWKESYDLAYPYVSKKQPIPPGVIEKMKPNVQKAHEYLQKAIATQADYADAWFYEKLVYIEEMKVSDASRQKDLFAKANEMQDKYTKLQKQQQQSGT
jgi:tetratricopeptide (TPR) repeat protein